jgi:hypothetical protein
MNGPPLIIPPRKGAGGRNDAVHAAIYTAYMVQDLPADAVATKVNEAFGTFEGRNSIMSYANRQGWIKGTGTGPKPKLKAMRPPNPPRVRPQRELQPKPLPRPPKLPPKARAGVDYEPEVAEVGEAPPEAVYRSRTWPANENSTILADLDRAQCRFPVGSDFPGEMDRHLFCGRPCEGPYCVPHASIAYNAAPARKVQPYELETSHRRRPA